MIDETFEYLSGYTVDLDHLIMEVNDLQRKITYLHRRIAVLTNNNTLMKIFIHAQNMTDDFTDFLEENENLPF